MSNQDGKKYDVGILGWWYGKNYGSIMTYYGLNRAIRNLGRSVLMVHESLGYNGYRVKWPDDILSMDFARRMGYDYTAQQHYAKLRELNRDVATFVVGSDQLWNPRIGRVNDDLFLDFVGDDNRRVAYATSFGNRDPKKFAPEFIEKQSANLRKFDAISVREGYAVDIARNIFGVDATQVVDPVFLLPRKDYDDLADRATTPLRAADGKYLAVFFLDPNPAKRDTAVALADRLGLDRIVVIPNPDGGRKVTQELFADSRFEIMATDRPENFLQAYREAGYVITDSFHGSAFAVIFERPFSSIYNTQRGVDRFKNLLGALGFGDSRRLVETDTAETLAANPNAGFDIDFSKARQHIETERAASLRWLAAALTPGAGAAQTPTDKAPPGKTGIGKAGTDDKAGTASPPAGGTNAATGTLATPAFTAGNDAWSVTPGKGATLLAVAPGRAVKGNQVWCDLPGPLRKGAAYRLTLDWTVHTAGAGINLHIRNGATGTFRVIGTVPVKGQTGKSRRDSVDFIAPDAGFNQFMLGAIHFGGANGGAGIAGLSVEEIPVSAIRPPEPMPAKKGPTHAEQAMDLALKDVARFTGSQARGKGLTGARARLMFHAHAIEKGLSRSDFRPGFGRIAVPGLAKEMNGWLKAGNSPQDSYFETAAAVMRSYFDRHAALRFNVSQLRGLFDDRVLDLIGKATPQDGGVLAATALRETQVTAGRDRNFLDVVYARRSVREFTRAPVADEDIRQAVEIAMQAPSVCNRQGARVHLFSDQRAIKAALDLQGGFAGYEMPPKLLLVTADLDAFLFATERRQPFVDGGLFMMTLLLGLEQVGLGSCSLNTAMGTERETKIRKILGIPENEVFISFVAVGHFDPQVQVPRSRRVAVDTVLVPHDRT